MPDPELLSASGVRFARHQTPGTLRDLRRVVDAVFPEDESRLIGMEIGAYRALVLEAQTELNAKDFVRRLCQEVRDDIVEVIGEDRFYIQTNLYLRAARPESGGSPEAIGWHRETFYGPNMERSVNIWTPVRGVSERNTLRFIPKSQSIPEAEIQTVSVADEVTEKGSVGNRIGFLYSPKVIQSGVDLDNSQPMQVPEGRSAIFPGLLIHGAGHNLDNRIRFSVDFRILPFSAYASTSKPYHLASGKPYFELF
ncbi:MAG: phytanoyl-CoA dioxygenase family protein [Phenylobacterium sp.]|nr:phytanoyl-CoA dioxygenase family protein [Phenylobacterium sp.]